MAIKLPELDDKTYAELVEEARTALPTIYPEWSDHNPSDPGITLIELLAWLTEMIVYRTGRIPERSERTFLRLLSGGTHGHEPDLGAATEATLRDLRERYRAVTPEDYEALVEKSPVSNQIARAHCIPERNLSAAKKLAKAPGHMSLILMPLHDADPWTAPSKDLLDAVSAFFNERRLITTRFHAVGPTPVVISLEATIHLRDDAPPGGASVRKAIEAALVAHFHPWSGGSAKRGWPFGRDVDLSDILAVIDKVDGVEFIDASPSTLKLTAPNDTVGTRQIMENGKLLGLRIEPHELPRFDRAKMKLTLMERRGIKWMEIP